MQRADRRGDGAVEAIDKSGEARDRAVGDQPPRIDGEAGRRVCFQGY
jgi:hypothetical protein